MQNLIMQARPCRTPHRFWHQQAYGPTVSFLLLYKDFSILSTGNLQCVQGYNNKQALIPVSYKLREKGYCNFLCERVKYPPKHNGGLRRCPDAEMLNMKGSTSWIGTAEKQVSSKKIAASVFLPAFP
ncbi:MAG: hypothetical protein HFF69_11045 [Oscillospiraceae bacterium]|nr:hypothetical protein [Oscillospiraceae bacterium]